MKSETLEKERRLKRLKSNWYIKNRKRLLEKQKKIYLNKKREKAMKIINQKIVLRFD